MLRIANAAHINGYISSFNFLSWKVTCYSSLFLSSKKDEKDKNNIRSIPRSNVEFHFEY